MMMCAVLLKNEKTIGRKKGILRSFVGGGANGDGMERPVLPKRPFLISLLCFFLLFFSFLYIFPKKHT